jgi:hypothetical protein
MNINQLLIASNIISIAYAQQESLSSEASTPFMEWYKKQKGELQKTDSLSVKITSPAKSEQVTSGRGLDVSGISTDNSTSDCKVSVIVNGIRPYQQAIANGTGGTNDYSTWNFVITPTYTTIKEGPDNRITSKLECTPNQVKWYSVNVTGVDMTMNGNGAGTAMQTPFVLPTLPDTSDNNITDSSSVISNSSTRTFSTDSLGHPSSSLLSISLNVSPNSVTVGDDQTIEARVLDPVSHLQIDNATIELEVTDSAGNIVEELSDDDDGYLSYILMLGSEQTVEEGIGLGSFTATVRASAEGYQSASKTATFEVLQEPAATTSENIEQDPEVTDNESDNLFAN